MRQCWKRVSKTLGWCCTRYDTVDTDQNRHYVAFDQSVWYRRATLQVFYVEHSGCCLYCEPPSHLSYRCSWPVCFGSASSGVRALTLSRRALAPQRSLRPVGIRYFLTTPSFIMSMSHPRRYKTPQRRVLSPPFMALVADSMHKKGGRLSSSIAIYGKMSPPKKGGWWSRLNLTSFALTMTTNVSTHSERGRISVSTTFVTALGT